MVALAPHFTDADVERARAAIAVAFGDASDLASQRVTAHEVLRAVFPHATFEHDDPHCRHPGDAGPP